MLKDNWLSSKLLKVLPLAFWDNDIYRELFSFECHRFRALLSALIEAVLIKVWLEARVCCKINPFAVADSKLALSPLK